VLAWTLMLPVHVGLHDFPERFCLILIFFPLFELFMTISRGTVIVGITMVSGFDLFNFCPRL
jgi:hypothetical protein